MKYLLVSGGEVENYTFFKEVIDKFSSDYIVAIDKGANHLEKVGIKPDLLLGDFDSINSKVSLDEKYNNIMKLQIEKDDTDTSAALDYAMNNGASEIIILAGIGSRFDHSFGNILLLKRAMDKNIKCKIINEQNEIELHKESFNIKNQNGKTISFFALDNDVTLTLKGFHYPLDKYLLNKYDPLNISNIIESDDAKVIFSGGSLLSVIVKDK